MSNKLNLIIVLGLMIFLLAQVGYVQDKPQTQPAKVETKETDEEAFERIKSGTVEDYKKFVEDYPDSIYRRTVRIWIRILRGRDDGYEQMMYLPTSIAKELVDGLASGRLHLNGLKTLSKETATEIAKTKCREIKLNGIAELTKDVAAELTKWQPDFASLHLDGLISLEPEVAAEFVKWNGYYLSLNGLKSISKDASREIGKCCIDWLCLNGVKDLTKEEAAELSKLSGRYWELNGLTTLPKEIASELSRYGGVRLELNGLQTLTKESARRLSRWRVRYMISSTSRMPYLLLNGLTLISPEVASELVRWEGDFIYMTGLSDVSSELIAEFAKFRGRIRLNKKIEEKISECKNEWHWAKSAVSRQSRIAYCDRYLDMFPEGYYAKKVQLRKDEILKQQDLMKKTLDEYKTYLKDNPNAENVDQVKIWVEILSGNFENYEKLMSLPEAVAYAFKDFAGSELDIVKLSISNTEYEILTRNVVKAVYLNNVKELSKESAKALTFTRQKFLCLNGLTTLSKKVASELVQWEGEFISLQLNGLKTLSVEVATELSNWFGEYPRLYLNGLENLSKKAARELVNWRCVYSNLYLNGLKTLSPKVAKELAKWKDRQIKLYLDGLKTLSEETAQELANWQGMRLNLDGINKLTKEAASALAKWQGTILSLNGFSTLPNEVMSALAHWEGRLHGLTSAELHLNGLKELTAKTASEIAKWGSYCKPDKTYAESFRLNGKSEEEIENALRKVPWTLHLNGLTSLSAEAAKELAKWWGTELHLEGVTNLDDGTAEKLMSWKGSVLHLNGMTELSEEVAKSISGWDGKFLMLDGVKSLSPEAAEELVKWEGDVLHVHGLTNISEETAKALAKFKGSLRTKPSIENQIEKYKSYGNDKEKEDSDEDW